VVVRGADIREIGERAKFKGPTQFIEWQQLNRRRIQWGLDYKKHESIAFRQLSTIFNDHFTSGLSAGIDKDEKMFLMSDVVLEAVARIVESQKKERRLRFNDLRQISDRMDQLYSDSTLPQKKDLAIEESNRGLFQEIEKACKQFPKVLAWWGSDHFTTDDNLIKSLEQANISYVILLPNKQRMIEAYDEIEWNQLKWPTFELKVGQKAQPLVLEVPLIFKSYLHPELQAVCVTQKDEPIVLNVEKLHEIFLEGKTFEFPARQKVILENIPRFEFNMIRELSEKTDQTRPMVAPVQSIINNLLMVHGLSVDELHFKGKFKSTLFTTPDHKPALELSSSEGWFLSVSSDVRFGYLSYLFQEMKRLNLKEYSLAPGQALICLIDLPEEEADRIMGSPEELMEWMESQFPLGTQFEGVPAFSPTAIELSENAPSLPAIALTTETSLTIKLT
jgi:hypothetical protein